jgi:hypothetical protein
MMEIKIILCSHIKFQNYLANYIKVGNSFLTYVNEQRDFPEPQESIKSFFITTFMTKIILHFHTID